MLLPLQTLQILTIKKVSVKLIALVERHSFAVLSPFYADWYDLIVGELKVIETESFLQVQDTLKTGALPLPWMLSV